MNDWTIASMPPAPTDAAASTPAPVAARRTWPMRRVAELSLVALLAGGSGAAVATLTAGDAGRAPTGAATSVPDLRSRASHHDPRDPRR